jgi:hypothetical protein
MSTSDVDLIGFLVTGFDGHYPVGTAAIVYAQGREEAKQSLLAELREQGLGKDDPDGWTLEPLTPPPLRPHVHIILNGDY